MAFVLAGLLVICALPINHLLGADVNALPVSVASSLLLLALIYRTRLNHAGILISSCIALLLWSRFDLVELAQSPVTATFLILLFLVSIQEEDARERYAYSASVIFLVFGAVLSLANNVMFVQGQGLAARSKGFGSGTIFALLAVYCIAYFCCLYRRKAISTAVFIAGCAPFVWALLLTQSRGAALTLALVLVLLGLEQIRHVQWSKVVIIGTGLVTLFLKTSFRERFLLTKYTGIEHFSSGRSRTQLFILDSITDGANFLALFIGFGPNVLKRDVYSKGLEFPHMDALYLLYEGGVLLLILFVVMLYPIYKRFDIKIFFWIFIISSLHTNMMLSPGFLVLGKVFDTGLRRRFAEPPLEAAV